MIERQFSNDTKLTCEGYSEWSRPIWSITIGSGQKTLICTAGVHGRESINPTVLVRMTKHYCAEYTKWKNYRDDFRSVTEREVHSAWGLLSQYKILFLPLLNPDGYEIALHQDKEWKYNGRKTDINRNFPCKSYRKQKEGDQPLSEAESRILADVFRREDSIGYIDFHSRGKEIYWYRAALDEEYNNRQKKIAQKLCESSGYRLGTAEDEMQDITSGGNTVQYYSELYRLPAITVETVDEEAQFPLDAAWIETTYEEIKEIPLKCLEMIKSS